MWTAATRGGRIRQLSTRRSQRQMALARRRHGGPRGDPRDPSKSGAETSSAAATSRPSRSSSMSSPSCAWPRRMETRAHHWSLGERRATQRASRGLSQPDRPSALAAQGREASRVDGRAERADDLPMVHGRHDRIEPRWQHDACGPAVVNCSPWPGADSTVWVASSTLCLRSAATGRPATRVDSQLGARVGRNAAAAVGTAPGRVSPAAWPCRQ